MVVPAVIPQSEAHLVETLRTFVIFAAEVQVDITDGLFTSEPSWPYVDTTSLEATLFPELPEMRLELDLMIKNPEETLNVWMALKPSRVVVHVESTDDLEAVLAHKRMHGYALGLAFSSDTSLALLHELDRTAYDYVELMGIAQIGTQGQMFDERVLERVHEIKATYPDLEVSVDGSVNETTLPLLKDAGADRFVVGSAIVNAENPQTAYENLVRLVTEG